MTRGSQQARDMQVTEGKFTYIIDHCFAVRQQPRGREEGGSCRQMWKLKPVYWKHHEQLETAIDKGLRAAAATSRAAGARSP